VSSRGWLATAVVLVGGTMWLWLPGPSVHQGGPLQEVTAGYGRFHVPPGRARVEWVMLVNTGKDPVTLSSAKLGVPLHGGAHVIGTAARLGRKVFVGVKWPPPVGKLRAPVDGFVVHPGESVSLAFGLSVPFPTRVVLQAVQVRYRSGGTDYRRDTTAAVTLCVTRRSRCPSRTG
jgi:hypothetical protein